MVMPRQGEPRLRASVPSREISLFVACLVAGGVFSAASPWFLTLDNLATVAQASVGLLIIALGMTIVLAVGGIDLTVGATMAIGSFFVGKALTASLPGALAALLGPLVRACRRRGHGARGRRWRGAADRGDPRPLRRLPRRYVCAPRRRMALRPARRAGAAGAADDSRRAGGRDRDRAPLPGGVDRAPLDAARHLVARHRRQRAGNAALRRAGAARQGGRLPHERPLGRNRRHLLRRPIPQRRDDHRQHHRARRDRRRRARRRPRRRRPRQPARHRARRHSLAPAPERLRAHRRAVAVGAGGGGRSSSPRPGAENAGRLRGMVRGR